MVPPNYIEEKMKVIITVLAFILLPLGANASRPLVWANTDQPLSKELISLHRTVTAKLLNIRLNHPELFIRTGIFDKLKTREQIERLKASNQYTEIKAALSSAGYRDLEQYFDVSQRLMAGWFAVQQKKQVVKSDTVDSIERSIKNMKESGVPTSVTDNMEAYVAQQKAMDAVINNVSDEDIKFIRENYNWIMGLKPYQYEGP